jgi:hypothetical protein
VPKYKNNKVSRIVGKDTYVFDSQLEAKYFDKLVLRLKAGQIEQLIVQPEFVLQDSVKVVTNKTKQGYITLKAIKYIADFKFIENGKTIVVDAKGYETDVYKLKKKLFIAKMCDFGVDEFREAFKSQEIIYKNLKKGSKDEN